MSSDKKKLKGMTRRDFFKGAAVAGAAVAGISALSRVGQARGGHGGHKGKGWHKGIPIASEEVNAYGDILEKQLLLRSSPIAIKMLKPGDPVPAGAERPSSSGLIGGRLALCQAFALARRQGMTIAMYDTDHWCFEPIIAFGLRPPPEDYLNGATTYPFLIADQEAAAEHAQKDPRLPYNYYGADSGMVFGPAKSVSFSPDLVMIYCNTGQLRYLILALGYKEAYMVNSSFYAIGSCGRAAVPPLLTHEATITVPDPGERDRASTGEDIMILTLPAKTFPVKKGKKRNLFLDLMEGIDHFGFLPYKTAFSPSMEPDFPQPGFYVDYFKEWGLWP
jgi:uncharacterized protein (DUF169 family)